MSTTTKERIFQAAEELMLTKSFHAVGLTEILAAVRVPKGSFYHYFSSKEQFGVELIAHYVGAHTERLRKHFRSPETDALQRFLDYWAYHIGMATEGECKQCCLVVKLGLEVSNFSEPMRAALQEGLHAWRKIFEEVVRAGQKDGSINPKLDPVEMAAVIQDTWQGAVQRVLVEKNVGALRIAAKFLSGVLRAC